MAKPLIGEELEKMLKNHLPKDMCEKSEQQKEWEEQKEQEKKAKNLADAIAKTVAANNYTAKEEPLFEIDKKSAMRYSGGDENLYFEVVQEYCKQEKEYAAKLQTYFDEKNWKEFRIIAHSIKGSSLLVGANHFSEKAKEMEFAVKEENYDKVRAEGQEFIYNYSKLVRKLEGETL